MQSWVFMIEYVSCDFIWFFFMLHIIFWRETVSKLCKLSVYKDNLNQLLLAHRMPAVQGITAVISAIQRLLGFCRNCTILQWVAKKDLLCDPWSSLEDCILWQGTLSSSSGLFLKPDETRMEKLISFPSLNIGISVEVLCESLFVL